MTAFNARTLIGRAVVSLAGGEKVGTVADIQLDLSERIVCGLLIGREGFFHRERPSVIPFDRIHTFGNGAVTMDDTSGITPVEEGAHQMATLADITKPVITAGGEVIGDGDDLVFDDATGAITALQLAPQGGFLGIGATTHVLPLEEVAEFGRDVITVHDAARARVRPDGK